MAATLTPAAITGKNILFTASEAVFLPGDSGRQIIFGASRAIIILVGASAGATVPSATVRADIIDVFPNTEVIPAGQWFLRLSPQADLTPNKKGPVGTKVTLEAAKNAFRQADLGKYIHIFGGVVEIQEVVDTNTVSGEILNDLQVEEISAGSGTYPAAIAGTWTLEVSSWSPANGFPRTGEFVQGRLAQASSFAQPTNIWMSQPDNFDNYAVGIKADDAIDYTVATRKLNRIEWITENGDVLLGGSDVELKMTAGRVDEAFGGDVIPLIPQISNVGSAPIQAQVVNNKVVFVDKSRQRIFILSYNVEDDKIIPIELTAVAEHITKNASPFPNGVRLGPIAYQKRLDQRLYFIREDGTLIVLTYFPNEKVIGFTRIVTQGEFQAVGCITGAPGRQDEVWVIVKRIINGETKRFIEIFEDNFGTMNRPWQELHTDCASVFSFETATDTVTGLGYLEGQLVDVVADGSYRGQQLVTGGQIVMPEAYLQYEIGLHYDSTGRTLRPSLEGTMIEGIPRSWVSLFLRLRDSQGGTINTENIQYPPGSLNQQALFTGDVKVTPPSMIDTDGRVTFVQNQPYPMTVTAIFGTLQVADHD